MICFRDTTAFVILLLTCCSLKASDILNNTYVYQQNSGSYKFVVTKIGKAEKVGVTATFTHNLEERLGKISDQTKALERLLVDLENKHQKISHIYIPSVYLKEVISRVRVQAINSDVWRERLEGQSAIILADIIKRSGAYDEIKKMLLSRNIEISSISIEKVAVEKDAVSQLEIPSNWITFISLNYNYTASEK